MLRLYIAGAVVAAALAGVGWWGHGRYQAGAQSVHALYAQRDAAAAEAQRILTRDRTRINQGIDNETIARQAATSRAAAADRVVVGELRDALAASSSYAGNTTATGCVDERRTIGVLAGMVVEGAELLIEGAERGAGLATQAAGLRDYVSRVCQMPVAP